MRPGLVSPSKAPLPIGRTAGGKDDVLNILAATSNLPSLNWWLGRAKISAF